MRLNGSGMEPQVANLRYEIGMEPQVANLRYETGVEPQVANLRYETGMEPEVGNLRCIIAAIASARRSISAVVL